MAIASLLDLIEFYILEAEVFSMISRRDNDLVTLTLIASRSSGHNVGDMRYSH